MPHVRIVGIDLSDISLPFAPCVIQYGTCNVLRALFFGERSCNFTESPPGPCIWRESLGHIIW